MAKTTSRARRDLWSQPPAEVYRQLETREQGLTEEEVERRRGEYGYNELRKETLSRLQILIGS